MGIRKVMNLVEMTNLAKVTDLSKFYFQIALYLLVKQKENLTLHQVSLKDVRANCFCASLLRTQIHVAIALRHSLSTRTEEDLQANIALLPKTTTSPGFCGLKRSVTPTFFWTHRLL